MKYSVERTKSVQR